MPVSPSADQFADTEGTTIFVKGFDKYLGEEAIRQQLTETFAECGAVSTVRLPTDRESGELKGIGFIEFGSVEAKVCTAVQSPFAWPYSMFVLAQALQSTAVSCSVRELLEVQLKSHQPCAWRITHSVCPAVCNGTPSYLPLSQISGS